MSQSHIPLELRRRVAEQARHRCGSTAHRYSMRGRRGWRLAGIRPKIEMISPNDARFTARLKAEYDKSLGVLLPIKDQLARTDALIDQVVYRLYGLSEEEIAVVEGKR